MYGWSSGGKVSLMFFFCPSEYASENTLKPCYQICDVLGVPIAHMWKNKGPCSEPDCCNTTIEASPHALRLLYERKHRIWYQRRSQKRWSLLERPVQSVAGPSLCWSGVRFPHYWNSWMALTYIHFGSPPGWAHGNAPLPGNVCLRPVSSCEGQGANRLEH